MNKNTANEMNYLINLNNRTDEESAKLASIIKDFDNEFLKGFICACAVTQRNHRCDSIVEDTLVCGFESLEKLVAAGVDQYDIDILMPIIKEIERKRKLIRS